MVQKLWTMKYLEINIKKGGQISFPGKAYPLAWGLSAHILA